ncbi:MAG: HAMP domain-containing histidine kinase [Planctomycetes bacterium]|nr:HAMP domain-containing histidine kinase [Planctomycetota bacterium]
MSIRQKILSALAASLVIAFVVIGTALAAVVLEKTHSLAEETRYLYAATARNIISANRLDEREDGASLLASLMPRSPVVAGWLLEDAGHRVLACRFRQPVELECAPGMQVTPRLLAEAGINTSPELVSAKPGRKWTLHVASPEWAYLPADAMIIALALFISMLVIMGVAYGITENLIITPLGSLAAASRMLRAGTLPPPIPATARQDEVGDLVRAFQSMAQEVIDYRHNMEHKVQEETGKRLQAEHNLVLAQRLSATSRLAAGIAHEINNPLAGVMNAVRALDAASVPPEKQSEYVRLIHDGLQRIDEIIRKMLSFQQTKPSSCVIPLEEVLESALSLAKSRLGDIAVGRKPAAAEVLADKGELVQAFLNLILNSTDALKDAAEPSISIEMDVRGDRVTVTIRDNGRGMSEDTLSHAFDLFYSESESGTGLGLSITHTIIENHGGEILITSRPAEGTTAAVTLPLARKDRVG